MNVVKDYCNLKLYMNTRFYANQNYKVDSIEDFLDTLDTPLTYNKLQYFKVLDVMKELKINCHQADIKDLYKYNYARIEIVNDYSNTEWILYYFVTKINWISSSAVKLTLQLDTLNSFLDRMTFSNRTYIEREHQSRYKKFIAGQAYISYDEETKELNSPQYVLQRYIPFNISEELNPALFSYKNMITMNDTTLGQVYIKGYKLSPDIIYNIDNTNSKTLIGTPVVDGRAFNASYPKFTFDYPSLVSIDFYAPYLEVVEQDTRKDPFHEQTEYAQINTLYLPFNRTLKVNYSEEESYTIDPTNLDIAGSNFLRATIIPYAPINFRQTSEDVDKIYSSDYSSIGDGTMDIKRTGLRDTQMKLLEGKKVLVAASPMWLISCLRQTKILTNEKTIASTYNQAINKIQRLLFEPISSADKTKCLAYYNNSHFLDESALYSVEFMNVKFIFNNNNYMIDLGIFGEDGVTARGDGNPIEIKFASSITATGGSYFKFVNLYTINRNPIANLENSNIMFNASNDDIPLISSEYINYLRYGYNYDKELNSIAEQKEWNSLNKSVETSIKSGTSFNPMKWIRAGQSAATTIKYGVQDIELSNLQRETEMQKTLSVKKGSKISVSDASGALPLATLYPILSYVVNAPSPEFREYYRRYFYLYGQKQQEYGIPTHNNRKIFDYLKCKAEFVNRNNAPSLEILTDMIDKLGAGVTFIHKITDSTTPQWIFDFEDKENIEVDLFNYLSSN